MSLAVRPAVVDGMTSDLTNLMRDTYKTHILIVNDMVSVQRGAANQNDSLQFHHVRFDIFVMFSRPMQEYKHDLAVRLPEYVRHRVKDVREQSDTPRIAHKQTSVFFDIPTLSIAHWPIIVRAGI